MIQSGDFIKIHYTGRLSDGTVFDTSDPEVAQKEGFEGKTFKPIVICVGQHMLVAGLDHELIGKPTGKFTAYIKAAQAFGTKDPKLVRIIPLTQLHKQQINPYPGLRLNIDGNYGVVRSVSSGRVIVDFNHPLASQDVQYDVEVLAIVDELGMQVASLLDAAGLPHKEIRVDGDHAMVTFEHLLPKPLLDVLHDRITSLTKCKKISFEAGTAPHATGTMATTA